MIRPAVEADVPELVAMIRELAELREPVGPGGDHRGRPGPHAVRARGDGPRLGRRGRSGALVGHALWYRTFSTFLGKTGHLAGGHLCPARAPATGPRHRAPRTRLRQETKGRLEWEVLEWNVPAMDFYQRLGARPMAGWTRYRWFEG